MIRIVTDSTAQLTEQEIRENHITVVPLQVRIDGHSYRDKIDISREAFSHRLAADAEFPQTSQPSIGEFVKTYESLAQPGDQILSIHIGTVLSGTLQAAKMASEAAKCPVTVFDTGLTDRGQAFVVLKAAELIRQGEKMSAIVSNLKAYLSQITLTCFVNSLDYLVKGGRASRALGFVSSIIKLKLVLSMADGKLRVASKARGEKGMQKLMARVVSQIINNPKVKQVGLSYVDSRVDTDEVAAQIKQARPDIQIVEQLTSPTIMTHVGPRGFAIIFA